MLWCYIIEPKFFTHLLYYFFTVLIVFIHKNIKMHEKKNR